MFDKSRQVLLNTFCWLVVMYNLIKDLSKGIMALRNFDFCRYCSKCKEHRTIAKKFDIWKLPPILVCYFLVTYCNSPVSWRWIVLTNFSAMFSAMISGTRLKWINQFKLCLKMLHFYTASKHLWISDIGLKWVNQFKSCLKMFHFNTPWRFSDVLKGV